MSTRTPKKNTALLRIQTMAYINKSQQLKQIKRLEDRSFAGIIEAAINLEPEENRWRIYEALKKQSSTMVGMNARYAELRTKEHYQVMVDFIDWMLDKAQVPEVEAPDDDLPDEEE